MPWSTIPLHKWSLLGALRSSAPLLASLLGLAWGCRGQRYRCTNGPYLEHFDLLHRFWLHCLGLLGDAVVNDTVAQMVLTWSTSIFCTAFGFIAWACLGMPWSTIPLHKWSLLGALRSSAPLL